jgi:hypothetical protein
MSFLYQYIDDDNHYLNLTNYQESELHNMEGIKIAESGDYSAAMAKFNEAIKVRIFSMSIKTFPIFSFARKIHRPITIEHSYTGWNQIFRKQ